MNLHYYQINHETQWKEIEKNSDFFRHKATAAAMSVAKGILDDCRIGTEGRIALAGEEACGKTALFSYVCEELRANGFTVLPILCQSTACGTTPLDIMKTLVWQMEELFDIDQKAIEKGEKKSAHILDFDTLGEMSVSKDVNYVMGNNKRAMNQLQNRFAELATLYTNRKGQHLIVAVDGLDLSFQGRTWEETEYIPHLITKHLRVFVTCQQEVASPEDVVRKSLSEFSGGKVSSDWKLIASQGIVKYLSNDASFIEESVRIFEFLACSLHGASLSELTQLLKAEFSDISSENVEAILTTYAECVIKRADGHFVLAHEQIRKGILATSTSREAVAKAYATYRKSMIYTDAMGIRGFVTALILADDKDTFIDFCVRMTLEEGKKFVYPVAMEIFSYLYKEGNQWLEAVGKYLEAGERPVEEKLSFVSFLAFQVWDCFVGIPKEILYKKRLAEILILVTEHCLSKQESVQGNFLCGMLYDFMGEILYFINGPENPEQALVWYEKEAGIYEHMLKEYGPGHMGSLRGAYDKLERIYVRQGDEAHLEKAEYYFQKEVLFSEKVTAFTKSNEDVLLQSYSLEKLSDFLLNKGGKENLEQAQICAMRALSLRAVLSDGQKEPLECLPVSYGKLSDVYYRQGGAQNIKKALEFREMQIRLLKRILKNRFTEKLLQTLSEAYHSLGSLYLEQGGPDNLEKAQKNFEESFTVMDKLLSMTGTVGSLRNLYVGYYKLGDVYAYYGERDTMIAARHYFTKAKEICERLNAELKTQESKDDLHYIDRQLKTLQSKLDSYGKKGQALVESVEDKEALSSIKEQLRKDGEALEEQGGMDNLLAAIEKFKEELSILQGEEAKKSTPENRGEIADAHLRIGNAYEQMGDRNSLTKAMRQFSTALQLNYQLDQEESSIRTQRALATAYIFRSNCCEKLGSREDVFIARDGYLQAKAIRERIYDKLHDEQSRKELAYCERQLERLEQMILEQAKQ